MKRGQIVGVVVVAVIVLCFLVTGALAVLAGADAPF